MESSPAGRGTTDPGPVAPAAFMRALIDGEPWCASSGLQAAHRGGILAFSGAAGERVLTLAIVTAGGPGPQTVGGGSPANAMLVLGGGETWVADGTRGGGTVTLSELTARRAAGTFELRMFPRTGPDARADAHQVTDGAFDVRF